MYMARILMHNTKKLCNSKQTLFPRSWVGETTPSVAR